jgi:hypothetical protein
MSAFQKSKRNHGFTNVKISTRSGREIKTIHLCMHLNAAVINLFNSQAQLMKGNASFLSKIYDRITAKNYKP